MKRNRWSKAIQALNPNKQAPPCVATMQQLQQLHPIGPAPIKIDTFLQKTLGISSTYEFGQIHNQLTIDPEQLYKTIKHHITTKHGSGRGLSGWSYEHLFYCIEDPDHLQTWTRLANAYLNPWSSTLPASLRDGLRHGKLIALDKGNNKIRPICIGECIRRAFTTVAIKTYNQTELQKATGPYQYAIATPTGAETMARLIETTLLSGEANVAI